jgi:hypothetical protein
MYHLFYAMCYVITTALTVSTVHAAAELVRMLLRSDDCAICAICTAAIVHTAVIPFRFR